MAREKNENHSKELCPQTRRWFSQSLCSQILLVLWTSDSPFHNESVYYGYSVPSPPLRKRERADNILFLFIDHWPIGSYKQTWWEEWESSGNTQHWTRFKDWIGIWVISVHRGRIKWIFHDEKGKMYQIKSYAFITVLFLLFLAAKLHCISHPSLENCCVFSS